VPSSRNVQTRQNPDPVQLRALVELMLSSESARSRAVPLHHAPESLARSPAKLEVLVNSLIVFIEKGIADATVQDLLDAAGISRRTFYKYFRNKIDVLESLYKLAVDVMVLRYQLDIAAVRSVQDVARHLVDAFFAYHHDLAPVIRMMQEEALRVGSPLAPHRAEAMATITGLVNDQIMRISGKRVDPLLIRALMGGMESASIEYLRGQMPSDEEIAHGQQVMIFVAEAALERAVNAA